MQNNLQNLWGSAGGEIPDGWELVSLEDLLISPKSITVGVMYPGSHCDSGVPLIKVSDVKNGKISKKPDFSITDSVDQEYKRTKLSGDELLITLVGNPGDCVVVTDNMVGWNAARALAVVRLKDPELREWLKLILLSPASKHIIDSRLNTTVQRTLNLKDIKELPVPLPPIQIRNRICNVVKNLETKIELNRLTNQTLEQMAQALFKSWFVDFDPVIDNALAAGNPIPDELQARADLRQRIIAERATNPKLKQLPDDIQQLFPSEFEESGNASIGISGWIPKGWEVRSTEDEFQIQGGSTPSTKTAEYWEGGDICWTSPKDLSGNNTKILLDTSRKITEKGLAKITSGLLPINTVLMSSRAPVGYLALAKIPLAINQGYIALQCKKTISPEFAIQWLDSIMEEIKGISGGTTFAEISKKTFKSVDLLVPSIEVVKSYTEVVAGFYQKISKNVEQSNSLIKTRDSLLPKLISGEVSLPDAKAVVAV
jgi:type I restriction enzyme S subunit